MTEFENFAEKIKRGMQEYCGKNYVVELNEVRKNNGTVYHGITIIGEGENMSPTIYVDELYTEYKKGIALGEILKRVIDVYEKHKIREPLDMSFLLDYDWVKERVVYKLIGYEKNKEMLREVPHIRFLDMAVVFYCRILHDTFGSAAVLVKNELCRMWHMETEDLYAYAEQNTPRLLPQKLMDLKELNGGNEIWNLKMYVLTNQQKRFGAGSILYSGMVEEIAEMIGTSFWILPSSVHEVILLPQSKGISGNCLKEMVAEVNKTQLSDEEILTDSVYYYDTGIQKIRQL